jgi:hypothetical protein
MIRAARHTATEYSRTEPQRSVLPSDPDLLDGPFISYLPAGSGVTAHVETADMYWFYDLPDWLSGILVGIVFVSVGSIGLVATRRRVRKLHGVPHSHNEVVGFYLGAIAVFYGITLGLLAVSTWTTYSDVEAKVDQEAIALGGLYRSVSSYPEPVRSQLQQELRSYAREVIDVGWPEQRRGIVPYGGGIKLAVFQTDFLQYEPKSETQKIVHAEAYRQFNSLVERRRARLDSVTEALPGVMWAMVLIGALISIGVTWLFDTASFRMHFYLTSLLSALLGLIIFLVAVLDNPYRGTVSVGPEAIERVYDQIMTPSSAPQVMTPSSQVPPATPK